MAAQEFGPLNYFKKRCFHQHVIGCFGVVFALLGAKGVGGAGHMASDPRKSS